MDKFKTCRCSCHGAFIAGLAAIVLVAALLDQSQAQEVAGGENTIKGTVVDADGNPLKDVSVWVYTATPKNGPGYL